MTEIGDKLNYSGNSSEATGMSPELSRENTEKQNKTIVRLDLKEQLSLAHSRLPLPQTIWERERRCR